MNKRLYRVIYNYSIGLWQVASELTLRKGARSSGDGEPCQRLAALRAIPFALWAALGWVGLVAPGQAQIVPDHSAPANQQPSVQAAGNGVPVVNIQTPSAGGVSRNHYQQFDVDRQGAILNNARGNVQTQLGGWIAGNPHLAGGSAQVILNEVNSANPSQLRGYLEVGGQRASVVIANPAGIDCDGCGFINANRATLTTGLPQFSGNTLDAYRVQDGRVRIFGRGMDASQTDYAEILSRAVEVNAKIWANQLRVVTGSNTIQASDGAVRSTEKNTPAGSKPAYALDIAQLGGMYAGKIFLIGTEAGLGVRNAGTLSAQSGDLVVSADGRLENRGTLQARGNTQIETHSEVQNSGVISAGRALQLKTTGLLDNQQGQLNAGRLDLTAQHLRNSGGRIEQTGTQALAIRAQTLDNHGQGMIGVAPPASNPSGGAAAGPVSGGAGSGGSNGGTTNTSSNDQPELAALADGQIQIGETLDNSGGTLRAGGAISAQTARLDNTSGTAVLQRLEIGQALAQPQSTAPAFGLDNSHGALSVGAMDVHNGRIRNVAGQWSVGATLALHASDWDNTDGTLMHAGNSASVWQIDGAVDNTRGTVASNAAQLQLHSGSWTNDHGTVQHSGKEGLQISTAAWNGANGTLVSNGALDIHAATFDQQHGVLQASQLTLSADQFNNQGGTVLLTGAQQPNALTAATFNNQGGQVHSNAALLIDSNTLNNAQGQIQQTGAGPLSVHATTLNGAGGQLTSQGALAISGQHTDLSNGQTQGQQIAITTDTLQTDHGTLFASGTNGLTVHATNALSNTQGVVASQGMLDLHADALSNTHGQVLAIGTGPATVQVDGAFDNSSGVLSSGGTMAVHAGSLANQAGHVQTLGAGTLGLTVDGLLDNSAQGAINAADALVLHAQRVNNQKGALQAGQTLDAQIDQTLDNRGGSVLGAGLRVAADQIENQDQGLLAARQGDAAIHSAHGISNQHGLLQASGELLVQSVGLSNASGNVVGGTVNVDTGTGDLANMQGVIASVQGDLALHAADIDNRGGQLQAQHALSITGRRLDNTSNGQVQAGQDANVQLSGDLANAQGLVNAAGGLTLTAAHIDNQNTLNSDRSTAQTHGIHAQQLQVQAQSIDNQTGWLAAEQSAQLTSTGLLDNRSGVIASNGRLQTTADTLSNSHGTLQSAGDQGVSARRIESVGQVLSGRDLSLVVAEDLHNEGQIQAAGRADVGAGGQLTNPGQIRASDLSVHARQIDNQASGQISANSTQVHAADTVTNRGLIDGQSTRIDAATLDNVGTGRLYGDHLSLQAGRLTNREETLDGRTQAAVIAAREQLDIGATTVSNTEHAQIFSAGSGAHALTMGGTLDADGHAIGQAQRIDNASATIESLGGLSLSANTLNNSNAHFATDTVGNSSEQVYIQPDGDSDKYPASQFHWQDWSRADLLVWTHPDGTQQEVKRWTEYYVTETQSHTVVSHSDPGLIRAGGDLHLAGNTLINDKSQILAGGMLSGDLEHLDNIAALGETRLSQNGRRHYTWTDYHGGVHNHTSRKWTEWGAYQPADVVAPLDLGITQVQSQTAVAAAPPSVDGRTPHASAVPQQTQSSVAPSAVKATPLDAADSTPVTGPQTQSVSTTSSDAAQQVRTVAPTLDTPTSRLFQNASPDQHYLIETDPTFANYQRWLSSDYLLQQLGINPAQIEKRLGDGFYEQRLLREQLGLLTGRPSLADGQAGQAQYQQLLDSGARVSGALNLRVGVALSPAQMAQLTSDIVWLVEREVTLPNGTRTKALVPQVYVRVAPNDLHRDGTLLSADAITLHLHGDLVNGAEIAGRRAVDITAQNLHQLGGSISGDTVSARTTDTLDVSGGSMAAVHGMVGPGTMSPSSTARCRPAGISWPQRAMI